ncbi:hypothetical protein NKH18_33345 [Streptomyces sp. M10(2022)]
MQLNWPEKIKADRIVLSDRTTKDDANGGLLTFSDGSEVKVEDIPAKEPKTVNFAMKSFDWVRFQTEGGTGYNNGLLEFEVDAVPSAPEAPKRSRHQPARASHGAVEGSGVQRRCSSDRLPGQAVPGREAARPGRRG